MNEKLKILIKLVALSAKLDIFIYLYIILFDDLSLISRRVPSWKNWRIDVFFYRGSSFLRFITETFISQCDNVRRTDAIWIIVSIILIGKSMGGFRAGWKLIGHSLCLQVSWIRKRDLHILTSSIHAYTGDARFSVKHPEASDEWTLKIAYVQLRDAGVYECQVNTEPKMNLAFMLKVEGKIRIARPLSIQ